jgi:hypothetical protein
MKRLIYSPSINVWIKTDTGIFDLSPYITNCTVDRRVNSVSFAQLEFRNPKITDPKTKKSRFMFTEHVRDDGSIHPMFHPMDSIIITMTRLRGRPIQVFTGFCDTAPYVQVYPGTAKLEASCTLKRLQYTYWDPALPFVQAFMTAHGWGVNIKTGTALNPNAEGKNTGTLNDTSIGYLLYTILKEVGGWDSSNIYIQELPGDKIGKLVANLYQDTAREEAESIKDFHKFLGDIIGASAYGSYQSVTGDSTPSSNTNVNSTSTTATDGPAPPDIEALINQASSTYNIDSNIIREVMRAESNFNQNAVSPVGARGLMQLMPDTAQGLGVDPRNKQQNVMGGAKLLSQLYNQYDHDIPKMLAAYNAGPGNVNNGAWTSFSETTAYVHKICRALNVASPV